MKTLYLLSIWFGAMLLLSLAGAFDTADGKPPLSVLLAITVPLLAYAADRLLLNHSLFEGIDHLDRPTLIFLQTERILGVFFLVEYARGHLPAGFALPAGLGDVAVGLAAPWIAHNLLAKKPSAVALARLWNYLGILDLVVAVSMGVTHGNSLLGIFGQGISMQPIAQYPLSLIPTFAVPLALILHLRSLQTLADAPAHRNAINPAPALV